MMPLATAPPPVPAPVPPKDPKGKPLTERQTSAWWGRITGSLEATKPKIDVGKRNIERYNGEYFTGQSKDKRVGVPSDFYYVEQKKSGMFYRLPEVFLKPELPGIEDAAVVFQAALNKKLGPKGVNVLPRVQQAIFDVLCPTGWGAVKVGLQVVEDGTKPVQVGTEPDPDAPMPPLQPGAVLGLQQPPMRPIIEQVANIVASWMFIEHVSPGDLIVPAEFKGLDFDDAPFLGMRFEEDVLDDDESGGTDRNEDERRLTPLPPAALTSKRKVRTGYEIWYKAHRFDSDIKHPDQYRTFKVYDDDRNAPIVPKNSPYQQCTPSGKLIMGMKGNPICPLTIRFVSDTWAPKSDCSMARPIADELSEGRSQMIQARDRNMAQVGFDSTRVTKDTLTKLERNEMLAYVGFDGPYQDAIWAIQKGKGGRESYEFEESAQGDLGRIWGMGASQLGDAEGSETATAEQIASKAAMSRQSNEQNAVLSWYVDKVVAKFAALMQMFSDEEEFVELIGADAQRLKSIPPDVAQRAQQAGQDARVLVPWNKASIQGPFSFSAKPDSQLFMDTAAFRKELMNLYNFFANEPNVNRSELVRQIIQAHGFDPSKMIQQPPPKAPEPPKLALSIKMEDFVGPQGPITIEIAQQNGMKISAGAIQQAQANFATVQLQEQQQAAADAAEKHGGPAVLAQKLNQHPLDQTGGMQGSGAPAPIAPGGHL